MFYFTEVEDYIRVEPKLFGIPTIQAVEEQLRETYADYYDKELGRVVSVIDVLSVGEGIIIPGDGAAYYNSTFTLLAWKPELHELVYGVISEITSFGAFIDMGAMRGMIHISQTMEDYVSFSKTNALTGKSSKKVLKQGDLCMARIVAISHKGDEPKIGLTMRQPGLGKLEWIKEDAIKKEKDEKKMERIEEREAKGKGGKKGGKKKE
ncbi:MAG: DNA-directed RNA polymerase [Candidatus Pacearchaeota archaeon]|nr:DNA-directed RNA polymerase [Nanoarchaeota archaeon]MDZ4226731.1 DNA-directed RNA polymerase [Candidatus Pacearchaeota archaeon]